VWGGGSRLLAEMIEVAGGLGVAAAEVGLAVVERGVGGAVVGKGEGGLEDGGKLAAEGLLLVLLMVEEDVFEGDGAAEAPLGEGHFLDAEVFGEVEGLEAMDEGAEEFLEAFGRFAVEGDGGGRESDVLVGVEHGGLPGLRVNGVKRRIVLCGVEAV